MNRATQESEITHKDLLDALTRRTEEMCPASREQYDRHCRFIDEEMAARGERERVLRETARLLSETAASLRALEDRVLVVETSHKATWKTITAASVLVGLLSSLCTLVGGVVVFGIKAHFKF